MPSAGCDRAWQILLQARRVFAATFRLSWIAAPANELCSSFTERADRDLDELENNPTQQKRLKSVRKALGYLQADPRHPGLDTHKFTSLIGPRGEEVFEAYAENNTPGAYRIFWFHGPGKNTITVIAITPHP